MKYTLQTCPDLNTTTNRCTRYATRPGCCRRFPRREGYCEDAMCTVPDADCTKCTALCCRNVVVPDGASIFDVLDMTCEECEAQPYPRELPGMLHDDGFGTVRTVEWSGPCRECTRNAGP